MTLPLHSFTYLNPPSSAGIIPRQYGIRSQGKWKDKLSQRIASNSLRDKNHVALHAAPYLLKSAFSTILEQSHCETTLFQLYVLIILVVLKLT